MVELMERKNRYYQALLTQVTPQDLLPGVGNLLEVLRAADLSIAIGSASRMPARWCSGHIAPFIDALADGYSVVRPSRRRTCSSMPLVCSRVCVHECVVFEDATAGVEAAQVAGMYAVGLGPIERVGQAEFFMLPDLSQRIRARHSPASLTRTS